MERAIRAARALVYETNIERDDTRSYNAEQVLGEEPPHEQSSAWWQARIHPDDRGHAERLYTRQIAHGGRLSVEYRVWHAEGRWLWVQDDSEVFLDAAGMAERRIGTLIDIDRLKTAQAEIEERQRLIDALIAGTSDLIWTKDREGRITFANKATFDLLGAGRPDHVLGRDAYDLVPDPLQARQIVDNDNRVLDSERPILVEEPFGRGDGLIVFQSHKAPLRNSEGQTIGVLGVSRDVTNARRLEQRLRQSELRFRATFDNAAVGMAHLALDGRWLTVNDKLCAITGYSRDELLARRWQDLTEPESVAREEADEQRLISGAISSFTVDKRYWRKDGTPVWVAATISLARGAGGEPDFLISVVRDISDEKRALAALAQSEALFRLIADNSPAMVWLTDENGKGLYVSQTWYELTGLPPGTARGAGWMEPIHPEDRPRVKALDSAQRATRGQLQLEYRLRDRNGAWHWVIDMAVPLFDGAGHFQGWVGSIVDITDRKQAEAGLIDSRNHQAFVLALSDRLRQLSDPTEVQYEAARALGDRLGASRVGYAEDEGDGETVSIRRDYPRGLPSLVGTYRYIDYGAELLERLGTGETVVRPDIAADPTLGETEKLEHARLGLASTVNVPLIKNGKLTAILFVHQDTPRHWLPSELALIRETAERTWAAVAQARAEAQSRRTLRLLESIMAAAPVSIYLHDVTTGRNDLVSPRARQMLGYDEPTWTGLMQNAIQLMHPDDLLRIGEHLEKLASAGTDSRNFEYRMRHADGSWRWFLSSDVVFDRTADGSIHRVLGTATDITEKQRHEERMRFLMREVNHRSKNLLSVVQAIARSTSANSGADFLQRFSERLQSLSASQDLIVRNSWRSVPLDELVRVQLAHLGEADRRIEVSGHSIAVSAAASQTIGMALHELATNAMKHGSLRGGSGRVSIHWTCAGAPEEPMFHLSWVEQSDEPVAPPVRKGFGTRVIEGMVSKGLEAEVSLAFRPEGFRWEVRCPLRNLTENPAEARLAD